MEEKDCRNGHSFNTIEIFSIDFLNLVFAIGHGLFVSFPKISFFHDEACEKGHFGLIKLLPEECIKIILCLFELLFINYHLNDLALFSRCFLCAFTICVVSSFCCEKQLLDATTRPIPNIEISTCFLRNYLKNWLQLSSSEIISSVLCLSLTPQRFLFCEPRLKVSHHWKLISFMLFDGFILLLFTIRIRRIFMLALNGSNVCIFFSSWKVWSLWCNFGVKYKTSQLLLAMMLHIKGLLLKPLRKLDLRHRVWYALKDGGNADHFLDLCGESLKVVIPV